MVCTMQATIDGAARNVVAAAAAEDKSGHPCLGTLGVAVVHWSGRVSVCVCVGEQ